MASEVTFGGQTFEPREFADVLASEVTPDLRRGVQDQGDYLWQEVYQGRETEGEALFEVTHDMDPSGHDVQRSGVIYGLLMGMTAMRAAGSDMLKEYADPKERYSAAQSWVCENFSELIWWDCDA